MEKVSGKWAGVTTAELASGSLRGQRTKSDRGGKTTSVAGTSGATIIDNVQRRREHKVLK